MVEQMTIHKPREKAIKGMVCGIPTFGMIHADFVSSVAFQAMPINFGMAFVFPGHTPPLRNVKWSWKQNKIIGYRDWLLEEKPINPNPPWFLEVGEARNILAQFCLDNNMEWLYFRDDDTIAPPDAINKLFSDKLPIVGGNYPSKQQPPHNLILQDGYLGGYDDWRPGEIVECDNIGMGLTLIHTDVLRKIRDEYRLPWFKTINGNEHNDIQDICPHAARMTEDVYFCNKARHVGYKIYCDTGVQGVHLDVNSLVKHYYHPGLQHTVWEDYDGNVNWYPEGNRKERGKTSVSVGMALEAQRAANPDFKTPDRPVRVELGCPKGLAVDGFFSVDLYEHCDYQGDASDLTWLINKIGMLDEIRASHLLEHLPSGNIPPILKNWKRALRPGGQIEIAIPDFDWAAEWAFRRRFDGPQDYWQQLMMVYGAQRNPGDVHRTPINMKTLVDIVEMTGFEIVSKFYTQFLDARVQRSAMIVARKPLVEGEDPATGTRSLEEIKAFYAKILEDAKAKTMTYDGVPHQPMIYPDDPVEVVDEQLKNFFLEYANVGGAVAGDSPATNGNGEGEAGAPKGEAGAYTGQVEWAEGQGCDYTVG